MDVDPVGVQSDGSEVSLGKSSQDRWRNTMPNRRDDHFEPFGDLTLWQQFIEARNQYRQICEYQMGLPSTNPKEKYALEHLNDCYFRWQRS